MTKTSALASAAAASRIALPVTSRLAAACSAGMEACWLAALVVATLFFNTHSTRIFEPDKLALVRTLALVVAALAVTRAIDSGWNPLRTKLSFPSGASLRAWLAANPLPAVAALYLLFTLISTAFSISPTQSIWGSHARAQGLHSLLAYAMFALAAYTQIRTARQLWRLLDTLIFISVPLSFYGVMQRFGLDTYQWQQFFTQTRITSTLGNPIFVGGFLVPVIPLTATAFIHACHGLRTIRPRTSAHWLRAAIYALCVPLQLLALWYTGSRGPVLAIVPGVLLGAIVVLIATGKRRWVAALTAAGIAAVVFVAALNIPQGPLESLRDADTTLGRLGHLLDGSRDSPASTRQRVLIWQGVLESVLPHAPIPFTNGGTDRWNAVRPLVGYGLETLTFVFQQFFPPEFAQLDRWRAISQQGEGTTIVLTYSPTAPDRSHNEFLDALVFGGLLGAFAYLLLFAIAIYWLYGIAGLLPNVSLRRLYWILAVGGAISGAVATARVLGLHYVGVGLPLGMLAGTGIYLLGAAFFSGEHHRAPLNFPALLLCAGIIGALTAHFVELHFGIPTGATRLVLWLLLASAAILPRITQPTDHATAAQPQAKDARSRPKPGTTAATDPPAWLMQALMPTAVMITLAYILVLNPERAQTSAAILARSFGGSATASAMQPLATAALILCTWLVGSLLFAISDNAHLNLSTFLKIAGTAAASVLIFTALHVSQLASTARFPANDPEGTARTVRSIGAVFTHYAVWIIVPCLLLPYLASANPRARAPQSAGWAALATGALLTFITAANTNFAPIFADTFHHVALPFQSNAQYPVTIRLLEEAIALAPREPYYPLYLGNTLLEQSRKLTDEPAQTAAIQRAMSLYKQAQTLEPLHPDATTGLARLLAHWAELAPTGPTRTARATEAAQYFALASTLSPNNVLTLNEWAMLDLRQLNNLDGAETRLLRSLALDDQYDLTYLLLGDVHLKRAEATPAKANAEYIAAVDFYERGALVRTSFPILVALGRANRLAGNPLAAIAAYHRAMAAAPAATDLTGIRSTMVSQYELIGISSAAQEEVLLDFAPTGTPDVPQQKLIDTLLLGRALLTQDREAAAMQFASASQMATDTPQHLKISRFLARTHGLFEDLSLLQQAYTYYTEALTYAQGGEYETLAEERRAFTARLLTAQQNQSSAQLASGENKNAIEGLRSTLNLEISASQRIDILRSLAALHLAVSDTANLFEDLSMLQQAYAYYTEALTYAQGGEYQTLTEERRACTARLLTAQQNQSSAQLAAGENKSAIEGLRSTLNLEITARQRVDILQSLAALYLAVPDTANLKEADGSFAEALRFASETDQASLQQKRDQVRQQIMERERTAGETQLAAGNFTAAETTFRAALAFSAGEPQQTQLKQLVATAVAGPNSAPALTAAVAELEQTWLLAPIALQPQILIQQSKWTRDLTAQGQPVPPEQAGNHATYATRSTAPRYLQLTALADQLATNPAPQLAIEQLATAVSLAPSAEDRAALYIKMAALHAATGDIQSLRLALGELDAALATSTTGARASVHKLRRDYSERLASAVIKTAETLAEQGFTADAIVLLSDTLGTALSGPAAARLNLTRATISLNTNQPENTARAWTWANSALLTAAGDQRPEVVTLIESIRIKYVALSIAQAERNLADGDAEAASVAYQRALELSPYRSERVRIKLLLATALSQRKDFASVTAGLQEASSALKFADTSELAPLQTRIASITAQRAAIAAQLGASPDTPFAADASPDAQRTAWTTLASSATAAADPELVSRAYSNLADLAETGSARSEHYLTLASFLMQQPVIRWLESAQTSIDQARTYADTTQQSAVDALQENLHTSLRTALEQSAAKHQQAGEWDAARADLQKALAHATDRKQRAIIYKMLALPVPDKNDGVAASATCADIKTALQLVPANDVQALTANRESLCGDLVDGRIRAASAFSAANQPALAAQLLATALGAATTTNQQVRLLAQLAQLAETAGSEASLRSAIGYWTQAVRSTPAAEAAQYQDHISAATTTLNSILSKLGAEPVTDPVPTPAAEATVSALQTDAKSAIAAGNYFAAEGALTAAIAISPAGQSTALRVELLQLRTTAHEKLLGAAKLSASSDLTLAANAFASAIAIAPDAPARAAAALQAATALSVSTKEPLINRAIDFLNQGTPYFSASETNTAAALRATLRGKLFSAAQNSAQVALASKNFPEAQAQGQRALGYTNNGPQRADVLLLLAVAAHSTADEPAARDFAKRALRHAAQNQLDAVRALIAQLPPA